MRIFLIRHGETMWNTEARYQGHTNIQLSEKGRYQGERLGQRMARENINVIYSSDLSRAVETANYIAQYHNVKVRQAVELRELNFGTWEGLTFNEISSLYADLAEKWISDPLTLQIPQGELFSQLQQRTTSFINNLIKNSSEENIAIVSHGGAIRAIICSLLDIKMEKMWFIRQDNTAVNIFDFYDGQPILTLLNDTHHLVE